MDGWSWVALGLLFLALAIVGWGLFSPVYRLPAWTHRHDKCWHVLAFAGLALLVRGVWYDGHWWWGWLLLCALGLLTEIAQQVYVEGRYFSWGDVIANALGAAAGVVLAIPVWSSLRIWSA